MAGGGGDRTYDGGSEDDDNDSRHHVGGGVALGAIKEDLDKWIAGRGGDNVINVADGETQRDDHQEAEGAVHGGAYQDGPRYGF